MKIKTRVEDVLRALDNKTVKNEKTVEFKKQLLSNKRLKEYFKDHPEEKDILLNDITKNDKLAKNKFMFKHLSYLPSYVLPSQIMAVNDEQIRSCTIGTQNVIVGSAAGRISRDKTLGGVISSQMQVGEIFVDPTDCSSGLIQNLVSFPI